MIKNDTWIREQVLTNRMISPFVDYDECPKGVISYGLDSYGYDVRLGNTFEIFQPDYIHTSEIDPKNNGYRYTASFVGEICLIPPHAFVLARSVEYFRIPRSVRVLCIGKSTYARCAIIANVTPLEPEWEGVITIEITNTTQLPARVYANEGIISLCFFESDSVCERSYADKHGKYQSTTGITPARV